MKEHVPTICALAALAMILGAILFLSKSGEKPGDMAMLGLGTALGTIVSGFTPSFSQRGSSQTINAETATTTNVDKAPNGQKP